MYYQGQMTTEMKKMTIAYGVLKFSTAADVKIFMCWRHTKRIC